VSEVIHDVPTALMRFLLCQLFIQSSRHVKRIEKFTKAALKQWLNYVLYFFPSIYTCHFPAGVEPNKDEPSN